MLIYDKDTKAMSIVAKDTGDFIISLDNYLLDEGDTVYFTVNSELEKPEPLIQKAITTFDNYKAVVRLTTQDTVTIDIDRCVFDNIEIGDTVKTINLR